MDLTGAVWRKSSRSSNAGATCVEVARNLPHIVAVRDSTDPAGPRLGFTRTQWAAFVARVKASEHDL